MYTAIKLGDSVDKQTRRRTVTVNFTDGTSSFDKDFQFKIDETVEVIKRAVKSYLDEINFVPPVIDGDWIVIDPVPETPTQAELDFQVWVKDRADLEKLKKLVAEGIIAAGGTQQTNLQNKVTTGWKAAYFNKI